MATIEYSEAPTSTIDATKLTKTRFLDEERNFPYRDPLGRVNINLLNAALEKLEELPHDEAHVNLRKRVVAWQKAAVKALNARPADERLTFDELLPKAGPSATPGEKQTPTKENASSSSQAPRLPNRMVASTHAGLEHASAPPVPSPAHPSSGLKTVMRRRLFRKPKASDEPRFEVFSDVIPLEADLHYLGQIADARARSRPRAAKRASPSSPIRAARGGRRLEIDSDEDEDGMAEVRTRAASPAASSRSASSGAASLEGSGDSSDVYEVEALLDEIAGRGFLIRWAGWGPEHDTWEPEENVAPELVAAFRYERSLARSNHGDDYMLGRTRMLWCTPCASHHPADNFSSRQRGVEPACRACLSHHYRVEARGHVSMLTGASHETPARRTPEASVRASVGGSARASEPRRKRPREAGAEEEAGGANDDEEEASARRRGLLSSPWAPNKQSRPVARALSHRQAALEVSTSRLFGFGSM